MYFPRANRFFIYGFPPQPKTSINVRITYVRGLGSLILHSLSYLSLFIHLIFMRIYFYILHYIIEWIPRLTAADLSLLLFKMKNSCVFLVSGKSLGHFLNSKCMSKNSKPLPQFETTKFCLVFTHPRLYSFPRQGIHRWRHLWIPCLGKLYSLGWGKTKQNFVVRNGGKGDSYAGGLDVSLKNWTLDIRSSDANPGRTLKHVTGVFGGFFRKYIQQWII